jgi:hypothetical protein
MTEGLSASDVALIQGRNGGDGLFGDGNGSWFIIILFLFAFLGWGGNRGYGEGSGAADNYVLASDFATIQRQLSDGFGGVEKGLDTIRNGICDLGYESLSNFNNLGMNVMQGFNATQAQLADCCCKTQSGIERINTNNAMNTANIQYAIKDCCCENEKIAMQNRFDMAQYNCNTLQAIDKVGDRIIDYLANDKTQALRDENFALKLASSQACQNNVLINALRPTPVPSFPVPAPYGYGFGTTIA